jgi:phenylpyruvate tautomerase PptA (4-oxalocrotonate tautomerase family)
MPQIKLHLPEGGDEARKQELIREIRSVAVACLGLPELIGQVWLCETPLRHREVHPGRDRGFAFVEITMYAGRSPELKQRLMAEIVSLIHELLGIDPKEINCCIYEVAPENYYGGISHANSEGLKRDCSSPGKPSKCTI